MKLGKNDRSTGSINLPFALMSIIALTFASLYITKPSNCKFNQQTLPLVGAHAGATINFKAGNDGIPNGLAISCDGDWTIEKCICEFSKKKLNFQDGYFRENFCKDYAFFETVEHRGRPFASVRRSPKLDSKALVKDKIKSGQLVFCLNTRF